MRSLRSLALLAILSITLLLSSPFFSAASSADAALHSLSGAVRTLSGEIEKGATVQARHGENVVAEATSDASGSWTMKVPAGEYTVAVKTSSSAADDSSSSSRVSRASPDSSKVSVHGNVSGIDFVAFRRSAKFDLTGEIVGVQAKHLSTLTVELALASAPGVVVASTKTLSPTSAYFDFLSLAPEAYIVSVKTSLPSRSYAFSTQSINVGLTGNAHVTPVVSLTLKSSGVSSAQSSSFWNTLLVLALFAALYFKDRLEPVYRAAVKSAMNGDVRFVKQAALAMLSGGQEKAATSAAPMVADKEKSNKPKFGSKKEKTHVSTFVSKRFEPLPQSSQPESPVSPATPEPEPVRSAPKEKKRAHTPAPAPAPVVVAAPVAASKPKQQTPAPKAKATPTPAPAAPAPIVSPKPVRAEATVAASAVQAQPAAAAATTPSGGARFCGSCGNKRPSPTARYCSECGTAF